MKKGKIYLFGLLAVVLLGAALVLTGAYNNSSSSDKDEPGLSKGEKSELAALKCSGEEGEKKCGEEGEKKSEDEGKKEECDEKKAEKKSDEGKCGSEEEDAKTTEEESEE